MRRSRLSTPKFMDTAERLLAIIQVRTKPPPCAGTASEFRPRYSEEQFSYFWFALEVAAKTMKGKEKIASKCPKCQGKLFCEICKDYPLHRRYSGEAIQQVVETVHPADSEQVFKTLQLIRHTLMHGGRIAIRPEPASVHRARGGQQTGFRHLASC